ncbi:MAG: DUF1588 domain-containing protein [Candidatus Solibacter usitatus]|nr:DUF1588 domain-containing protein [Candidatus Solibacter usitatus]
MRSGLGSASCWVRMLYRLLFIAACSSSCAIAAPDEASFAKAQNFLRVYCKACHDGGNAVGGFRVDRIAAPASLSTEAQRWSKLNLRVRGREMPPKNAPAPSLEQMEEFTQWVEIALRTEACVTGAKPGPSVIRRLNRDEYSNTLRDLLDIHLDIAKALPVDGAGGEGFDNAAETLFLSPLHSEKYMDMAKFAMDFAAKEYKSKVKILIAKPGPGVSPAQAARTILTAFLPRAFRRPVTEEDVAPYLALFEAARKQGQPFEPAIFLTLRGVLVSPMFLYRSEPPNETGAAASVNQYALASRISYFLWGSMPDEFLFDAAAAGKLNDPAVVRTVVQRMLRNDRAMGFARSFVEQWLGTRDLMGDKAPDAKLFPEYIADEEIRSDIRLQPVLFFQEIFARDLSLLNFLDSKGTIGTSNLSKFFGVKLPVRANAAKQPQWVELPEGSHRGGLLGMPAVLTVSSYPYRTSPVLRGAWILDAILGTPPPPPPADVPALEEAKDGTAPKSMRERLTRHRDNVACASCHSRIDGLGFALENYDVLGRWREQDAGKPIDSSGELAGGVKFHGPDELKLALLEKKDLFLRNFTTKLLGFALGRGLTLADSCTVEQILEKLRENDYKTQTLVEAIILSAPFQWQASSLRAPPAVPFKQEKKQEKKRP